MNPESESPRSEALGLQVERGAKPARHFRALWLLPLLIFIVVGSATLLAWLPRSSPTLSPAPPNAALQNSPSTQPKITWAEKEVEVILSPGEGVSRDVTFTSDQNLQNVVIEPVPEIAPFVTVQPNGLATVPAGQRQSVRLMFSIPANATPRTYDGTVHVRVGSQTLPQTVKTTVAIWQHVVNTNLGFALKLPPAFTANNAQPRLGETVTIADFLPSESGGLDVSLGCTLLFSVKLNSQVLPLSQWMSENIRTDGVDTFVSFGGSSGLSKNYVDELSGEDAILVLLPKGNRVYVFSAEGMTCIPILEQILSTLVLL